MTEREDTRVEILIVGGVIVLFLWLWHSNQMGGAASGLSVNLAGTPAANAVTASGEPVGLTVPGLDPGMTFAPTPAQIYNVGGNVYDYGAGQAASCTCGSTGAGATYGSAADLASALIAGGYALPAVNPNEVY